MKAGLYRDERLIVSWNDLCYIEDIFDKYSYTHDLMGEVLENGGSLPTDVLVLPENIKSIPSDVFTNIELDAVIIQNGTTEICREAFFEAKIKHVILPNTLKYIDDSAFWSSFIEEIDIPDNIKLISKNCFAECLNLKKVKLPKDLEIIAYSAFRNCGKLEEINIPKSVYRIGGCAFEGCKELKEIILPENLDRLEECAFCNCNIKKFVIPKKVKFLDAFIDKDEKDIKIFMNKEMIKNLKDIASDDFIDLNSCYIINEKSLDDLLDEGKSFKQINEIYKEIGQEL